MKKLMIFLLIALLTCSTALATDEVRWTYDVPLLEIQSEYAILVNEDNLLEKTYTPSPLMTVKGVKKATNATVEMQETAGNALKAMFEAAAQVTEYTYTTSSGTTKTVTYENGMILYLKSGYRSYSKQQITYSNHLQSNNNIDDGYVAKPGASEHQTGLCADILNADYASRPLMTQDFKWTPEAQWMKEHCAEFGFILRYTEEGEAATGIKFEPWHFRYVGEKTAAYIMSKGMTLEDYILEATAAVEDFIARGGDLEEQMAYERLHSERLPECVILEEYSEDGSQEIDLIF